MENLNSNSSQCGSEETKGTKQRLWTFDGALIMLRTEDIFCIESYQRKMTVHTDSESYRITAKLSEEESLLAPEGFIRVHHSYLVKQDKINKMIRYNLFLTNGMVIPVSRKYKKKLCLSMKQTCL